MVNDTHVTKGETNIENPEMALPLHTLVNRVELSVECALKNSVEPDILEVACC